jgi:hypothetical protein
MFLEVHLKQFAHRWDGVWDSILELVALFQKRSYKLDSRQIIWLTKKFINLCSCCNSYLCCHVFYSFLYQDANMYFVHLSCREAGSSSECPFEIDDEDSVPLLNLLCFPVPERWHRHHSCISSYWSFSRPLTCDYVRWTDDCPGHHVCFSWGFIGILSL